MNQKVPVLRILWYKRDKTNTILYGRTALRMLECVFLFLLILLRRLVYLSQICPCSQLDLSNRLAPDDRGWDGWMAPLAQWTWVWVSSGSWWWTGRPGVLRSVQWQSVGQDWATELNWIFKIKKRLAKHSRTSSGRMCISWCVGLKHGTRLCRLHHFQIPQGYTG